MCAVRATGLDPGFQLFTTLPHGPAQPDWTRQSAAAIQLVHLTLADAQALGYVLRSEQQRGSVMDGVNSHVNLRDNRHCEKEHRA